MSDIFVKPDDNSVNIWDQNKRQFCSYDSNGNFLGYKKLKNTPEPYEYGIRSCATSWGIIFSYMTADRGVRDKSAAIFKFINGEVQYDKPIFPVNYNHPLTKLGETYIQDQSMSAINDTIYYIPFGEKDVYYITQSSVRKAVSFNFLDSQFRFWSDIKVSESFNSFEDFIKYTIRNNVVFCVQQLFALSKDKFVIGLETDILNYYLVDRKNNKVWRLPSNAVLQSGEEVEINRFLGVYEGQLVGLISESMDSYGSRKSLIFLDLF